jgi:hypothetical protein
MSKPFDFIGQWSLYIQGVVLFKEEIAIVSSNKPDKAMQGLYS